MFVFRPKQKQLDSNKYNVSNLIVFFPRPIEKRLKFEQFEEFAFKCCFFGRKAKNIKLEKLTKTRRF